MASGNKIKKIVLAIIVGAAILETCFFGYKSHTGFERTIIAHTQRDLLTIAKVHAWGIEDTFDRIQHGLKELAGTTKFQGLAGVDFARTKLLAEKTAFEKAANEQFDGIKIGVHEISWIDANGVVQNVAPFRKEVIGLNFSKRGGVKNVLSSHQSYTGGFFKLDSGQKYISICEPVFEEKQFAGLVQAVILLETLQGAINHITPEQKVSFRPISDTGVALIDSKAGDFSKRRVSAKKGSFLKSDPADTERIFTRMERGEEGVDSYCLPSEVSGDSKVIKELVAFTPVRIGNKRWSMSVTSDYENVSQPIKVYSRDLILGSIYFSLSILFVAWQLHKTDKRKVQLEIDLKAAQQLGQINEKLEEEINRRKKAEESTAKLLKAIEGSQEAIVIMSPEGKIIYANDAMSELFGYSKEELIGKACSILDAGGMVGGGFKTIEEMKKDSNGWEGEIYGLKKDGMEFVDYVMMSATKNESGELVNIISTHRDITSRKKTEEALQFRYNFEDMITWISVEFINLKPEQIDDGIERALATIGEFAGVSRSYIFQMTDGGKKTSNTHEWCNEGISSQKHRLQELSLEAFPWFAQKIRNREVVSVDCISDLPSEAETFRKELEIESIKSIVCVPMELNGELIGFTGFDAVDSERKWTEDTVNLLQIVSSVFANAIGRKKPETKFYKELAKNITSQVKNLV
jgi:PAS domain S-box-containing protein